MAFSVKLVCRRSVIAAVIPLKSVLYCQAKRDMQFQLKHLFLTVFAFSLLSLFGKFLFDNPPQMSGKILLILASPAAMGIGIIAFSLAGIFGNSASSCDADPLHSAKYKSLAWVGLFATLPLAVYVVYSCIAAPPLGK